MNPENGAHSFGAVGGGFRSGDERPTTRRTTSLCSSNCFAIVPTGKCSAKWSRRISTSTSAATVTIAPQPAPDLRAFSLRRRYPRRIQPLVRSQKAQRTKSRLRPFKSLPPRCASLTRVVTRGCAGMDTFVAASTSRLP